MNELNCICSSRFSQHSVFRILAGRTVFHQHAPVISIRIKISQTNLRHISHNVLAVQKNPSPHCQRSSCGKRRIRPFTHPVKMDVRACICLTPPGTKIPISKSGWPLENVPHPCHLCLRVRVLSCPVRTYITRADTIH
jgi:hypothetical protein